MRRFAPDPETTVEVTALRVFQHTSWTPQHRAGWRQDPLAKISAIAIALGAFMLLVATLGALAILSYALLF